MMMPPSKPWREEVLRIRIIPPTLINRLSVAKEEPGDLIQGSTEQPLTRTMSRYNAGSGIRTRYSKTGFTIMSHLYRLCQHTDSSLTST
jgi:hypothetical protein